MCELKAFDALRAANMHGSDATTSLDTFITRAARYIDREMEARCVTAEERQKMMAQIFGSDAVRAAAAIIALGGVTA